MVLKVFHLIAIVAVLSGCVSLKNTTAGEIGCSLDDITIGDKRTLTLTDYWEASCKGKHYVCSGSGSIFSAYQSKCKEVSNP